MFSCIGCGATSPERLGACPRCLEFGSWVNVVSSPHSYLRDTALVTAEDLWRRTTRYRDLGDLSEYFGRLPVDPCAVALYGSPGVGKSTLMLRLADRLAAAGEPVLYDAIEEGTGSSVTDKLRRLEIRSRNLHVGCLSEMPVVLERARDLGASWVFFDSLTQSSFTAEDIARIQRETNIALVYSLHATKAGLARGPSSLLHVADVVVRLEPGKYAIEKHRFAPTKEGVWSC